VDFKRHKIVLTIVAVVVILVIIGTYFVSGVRNILITDTQTSLQKISEQGANAVQTAIIGHLDALSALSEQSALTDKHSNNEKIKILEVEASRKDFVRVAYADANGDAITNDGQTASVSGREYFKKALKGQPNISSELSDMFGNGSKIVAYAVPVSRRGKVAGVLIATARSDGHLNIMDNVAVSSDNAIYVLSRNGNVISNRTGQEDMNDFFQYISSESSKQDVANIQQDFLQNKSGKGSYSINKTEKLVGYSYIKGTDGWMFMVAVEKSKIMAQANQILLMSGILFGILIIEFIVISIYFFKLKKNSYEVQVRREQEIKYFTYTDTLTKLPNRNGIKKQTAGWLNQCRTNCQNGGAFFLDVDNFQSVNNTFGHDVGDEFLAEAAVRLTKIEGKENIIGRIGGDEFALLILNVNTVEDLERYAKHILEVFKEPFLIHGNIIQLTVSVGAILFNCNEKKSESEFDEIIGRGEFVLSEAKRLSKGSYALFNDDFGGTIDRQHKMDSELKQSIENNELICYFQPQYNSKTKTIVGFEALVRWNSATFGMISPLQFIEMAEKNGFIIELGRYVVEQTFAFAKSLEGRNLRVSFNTSPTELLQMDFTDYVIGRFNYYGLAPGSVAIEVTESCLIESFQEVAEKLQILSDHGIMVYLDDFGTGFSSLTYLKNLPIFSVKIDKSFIDEIVTDKTGRDIVDMIVLLAQKLNLEVIAEGVETAQQIQCVSNCGCNIIQGYYISKPVPSEQAKLLLDVLHK